MPAEKYTKMYLTEQLKPELKEQLRADNLPPTRLPSYEYLNAKGFNTRGLNKAIQRHFGDDATLAEFLRRQGFGHAEGEWPTDDSETIRMLNKFRESRRKRNNDKEDTVQTMESALRKVLRIAQRVHDTASLLVFARFDTEQERFRRNAEMETILDTLKDELSDGAAGNYARYLRNFYGYAGLHTPIDYNPVDVVGDQYSFEISSGDPDSLEDEQLKALWRTLLQLPERTDLSDPVEHLCERHGREWWRLYAMVLLVVGVGVGARAKEFVRMDCRSDLQFGDRPYVDFPLRKNEPGEVPIMTHPEFLEAYRDFMELARDEWNGKPFPKPDNESGSIAQKTLNNWLKALADEAGVRLSDGSLPTLQNLRQTWFNQYNDALNQHELQVQLLADEAGTKNDEIVDQSYVEDEQERETIRRMARDDFESHFPLPELPDLMTEEFRDAATDYGGQFELTDF